MSIEHNDPYIEKIYNDLVKKDLSPQDPELSSASWEVVKILYEEERRRRRKTRWIQLAAITAALAAAGAAVYALTRSGGREPGGADAGI